MVQSQLSYLKPRHYNCIVIYSKATNYKTTILISTIMYDHVASGRSLFLSKPQLRLYMQPPRVMSTYGAR